MLHLWLTTHPGPTAPRIGLISVPLPGLSSLHLSMAIHEEKALGRDPVMAKRTDAGRAARLHRSVLP